VRLVASLGFLKKRQKPVRGFYKITVGGKARHEIALAGDAGLPLSDMPLNHFKFGFALGDHLNRHLSLSL
jgi:hypothetical protein